MPAADVVVIDRWTVDGHTYLQTGDAQDYNHGPFAQAVPLVVYSRRGGQPMAKPRIRWNPRAFAEIRTMPAVMAELDAIASRLAEQAGRRLRSETGGRNRRPCARGRAACGDHQRRGHV